MKPRFSINEIKKYYADQLKLMHENEEIMKLCKAKFTVMQQKISAKEQEDSERVGLGPLVLQLQEATVKLNKSIQEANLAMKGATG